MDVMTKMHLALAVMLTIYIVPLAYLVWLARHQRLEPPVQNQPEAKRSGRALPGHNASVLLSAIECGVDGHGHGGGKLVGLGRQGR